MCSSIKSNFPQIKLDASYAFLLLPSALSKLKWINRRKSSNFGAGETVQLIKSLSCSPGTWVQSPVATYIQVWWDLPCNSSVKKQRQVYPRGWPTGPSGQTGEFKSKKNLSPKTCSNYSWGRFPRLSSVKIHEYTMKAHPCSHVPTHGSICTHVTHAFPPTTNMDTNMNMHTCIKIT